MEIFIEVLGVHIEVASDMTDEAKQIYLRALSLELASYASAESILKHAAREIMNKGIMLEISNVPTDFDSDNAIEDAFGAAAPDTILG